MQFFCTCISLLLVKSLSMGLQCVKSSLSHFVWILWSPQKFQFILHRTAQNNNWFHSRWILHGVGIHPYPLCLFLNCEQLLTWSICHKNCQFGNFGHFEKNDTPKPIKFKVFRGKCFFEIWRKCIHPYVLQIDHLVKDTTWYFLETFLKQF